MKILLLEDNVKLNSTIKKRLELKDYQIDSFIDGQEAYDNIENGYSCFVLDINVPNIDGIKILKRIRESYKRNMEINIISRGLGFRTDFAIYFMGSCFI